MTPHHHSPEVARLIEMVELRDHRASASRHKRPPHSIEWHDIDGDSWITCGCGWTSTSALNSTEPPHQQAVKHLRHIGDGAA